MSLNVDTRKVEDKELDVFTVGVSLMAIGLREITPANKGHAQARIDYINALDTKRWGKPTLPYSAAQMCGANANVETKPFTGWASNIAKRFLHDMEER